MKHYIIVKFRSGVDYKALVPEMMDLFNLAQEIDGVKGVAVKSSCLDLTNRHDLMIEMDLASLEAMRAFDTSDIHAAWKNRYGEMIESKVIFDCE